MSVRALPARPARGRLLALLAAALLLTGLFVPGVPRLGVDPAAAATCPCSIWPSTAVPANPSDPETAAVEVGVKLRSDVDGFISGIRFYKGSGNTGTHVGNLWTVDGTNLATVTFGPETATGWQEARFGTPVAVTAGTTYVASYYAPNGRYAADSGAFRTAGVDNAPLHALADGVDGANGVYRYGAGGGFPVNTWQAANYWVDVVFETSGTDTSAPVLSGRTPAADSTGVAVDTVVSGTFNEPVTGATIAVEGPAGPVAGTSSYDSAARRLTLRPTAALATSTRYTATVSGAQDAAGNTMTTATWSFTTASTVGGCPCSLFPASATPTTASADDSNAVELGMRFRSDRNGFVTGIRFYKGSANTGAHVGSLWAADGTPLASAAFGPETASGWQQVTFGSPVAVTAGTDYVASYHAPNGGYAANGGGFATARTAGPLTAPANSGTTPNGVYRYGGRGFPTDSFNATNYWVDVVFDTSAADRVPPTVTGRSPADGATSIDTGASATATFSEAVAPASVVLTLRTSAGTSVPGSTTYDEATRTATLKPTSPLAASTTYTASAQASDTVGNAMSAPVTWSFTTVAPPPPAPSTTGPVLVVASTSTGFGRYLPEILKAEGLNAYATATPATALTATGLAPYDVVVLGETALTASQVTVLTDWVTAGGNLIAMRPDKQLAGLLGLTAGTTTLADGYLLVNTAAAPGAGITAQTMQFHGTADRYTLDGASRVATLYSDDETATPSPAVSLRSVGTAGGQAAAFTFDLARSVVYTRQGNPAFAGLERDGSEPIRSDDMFWGSTATNGYVNLSKVAVPQADEQQRLLANLVQTMNADRKPLPRFWYFPRMAKAVVVATGDDHGNNGTAGRYDQYAANSAAGCSVVLWSCLRFSSYVYPSTPLSPAAARTYEAQGFETGVHVSSNCGDFTASTLQTQYAQQTSQWQSAFSGLPVATTSRFHCIAYSDWASQPKVGSANGVGMDTNYYYWPGSWVGNRPGFMTGSGMPMRFADLDGTVLDSYQAATQMTDESDQSYPQTPNALIDNAFNDNGYYGAFVANVHTDRATIFESDQLITSAQARGVPVIAAEQLLTWVKGRDASRFTDVTWSGGTLRFGIAPGAGADGLHALLPTTGPRGSTLSALSVGGAPVSFTKQTVKGIEYAVFSAGSGTWTASYTGGTATTGAQSLRLAPTEATSSTGSTAAAPTDGASGVYLRGAQATGKGAERLQDPVTPSAAAATSADGTAPSLTDVDVLSLPDGTATVSWRTDEASDSLVTYGRSAAALDDARSDDEQVTEHSVVLTQLTPGATYHVSVRSADAAGNAASAGPVRFVQSAAGVADSTAAALKVGTRDAAAYVASRKDGELQLAGDDQSDFDTPQLPSRWATEAEGGGRTVVYGGKLKVDGTRAVGPAVSGSRTLDMGLTFTGGTQFAGLAAGLSGPWAMFASHEGHLYASMHDGKNRTDTALDDTLLRSPHRYRVEWTTSGVTMHVDDVLVAEGPVLKAREVRPMVRDLKGDESALTVDWLRLSSFKPSSTYVSRVLDAHQMVAWDRAVWRAETPAGTSVQVSVRTGNRRSPDGTWSAWTVLSGPGARVVGTGRYLQYRVQLASTNAARTPALLAIGFTHNGTLPRHEGEVE